MSDYKKQIEQFYLGKLPSSEIIHIGMTPATLREKIDYIKELPIIMSQSNLRKCIREQSGNKTGHGITRDIVEDLPHQLENPVMITQNVRKKGVVIISDRKDSLNRPIVIAMHLEKKFNYLSVNEVKSVYGRDNAKNYIAEQVKDGNLVKLDNKKANELLHSIGLRVDESRLPKENITISYDLSIKEPMGKVNTYQPKKPVKKPDIVREIRLAGFQPTKQMVNNISRLNAITKRNNSLKDISQQYKDLQMISNPVEKEIVQKIGEECKIQEIARHPTPEI